MAVVDLVLRSFGQPDLEVRSSTKGRLISGIAVPWDYEQEIDPYLVEGFRSGAFDHQLDAAHRVKLAREHMKLGGELIGRLTEMRNDSAGLWVEMLASRTPMGEQTVELVRDGALSNLSIAFLPRTNSRERSRFYPGRETMWRTRADLREVAVVIEGAYGDRAMATAVRSEQAANVALAEIRRVLDGLPPLPALPVI